MQRRILIFSLVFFTLISGCASLVGIRQQPEITLAGIDLLELGLFEQRFKLKLRVRNPNDVELVIKGMHFNVELNGQSFAKGISSQTLNVPRMGEAVLDVATTSSLASVWRQLQNMSVGGHKPENKPENKGMDYRLSGEITLAGLGSVPFEKKGNLIAP